MDSVIKTRDHPKMDNPKIIIGIPVVAALRILMAPLPNIEPIMLFTIVAALSLGPRSGFNLGFLSMITSDIVLGLIGPWTIYTSLTYGLIGILAGLLGIHKRNWGRVELTLISFVMTILYDLITATCFALEFMIPINAALTAQIPFTLLHLNNCIFVFLFAPYLLRLFSSTKDFSITEHIIPWRWKYTTKRDISPHGDY